MILRLRSDIFNDLGYDSHDSMWDFNISSIQSSIERIERELDRLLYRSRLNEIIHISRNKPVEKYSSYPQFKELIQNIAKIIPEMYDKNLEAQGFAKKKFKNDEEETKFMQGIKEKIEEELVVKGLEDLSIKDDECMMRRIVDQRDDRFVHGKEYIDKLYRIRGYNHVEYEGKRILAKYSLKVKMDKCINISCRVRAESTEDNSRGANRQEGSKEEATRQQERY